MTSPKDTLLHELTSAGFDVATAEWIWQYVLVHFPKLHAGSTVLGWPTHYKAAQGIEIEKLTVVLPCGGLLKWRLGYSSFRDVFIVETPKVMH